MPRTEVTLRLARKLAPRCAAAGIRIALVGPRGEVEDVRAVSFPALPLAVTRSFPRAEGRPRRAWCPGCS
jgi:hypothetical protein